VLSILSFFMVILGVADTIIYVAKGNGSNNVADAPVIYENNDNTIAPTSFKDLTKEEALTFLQNQTDITGTLPQDFVGKEITDALIVNNNTIVRDLDLIYSYGTIEELKQMACEEYNSPLQTGEIGEDEFEVKEYDYYAIVTPNKTTETHSIGFNKNCLLSFKREYLDYRKEKTTPSSYNDVYYLNTSVPEIADYLLRVYVFFSRIGLGGHGNIYSYSFEEQDDKFVLTVNNIGAGLNAELLNNPDLDTDAPSIYGINLYSRYFAADKSSGQIYVVPTETGTTQDVKTFPISNKEYHSLSGYNR